MSARTAICQNLSVEYPHLCALICLVYFNMVVETLRLSQSFVTNLARVEPKNKREMSCEISGGTFA